MSDVPAGWYPDPQPPVPGQAPQQRYWDGTAWTAHVAPLAAPAAVAASYPTPHPGPGNEPGPYAGTYGAPAYGAGPAYGRQSQATTPDGQPLAGWWQRVLATVIDLVVVVTITLLLSIPLWGRIGEVLGDYFDEVQRAADTGSQSPSTLDLQSQLAGTYAVIGLLQLLVVLVYNVGFLMWKQATPGKLALGLRVRRRDEPGPMPLRTVLLRWVGQYAGSLLRLVPLIGTVGALYTLLDVLWPLWDPQKQALHDKLAGTNVVRTR